MNILFDLNHPVDVNFFKNAMLQLQEEGHHIFIIFRGRGKLEKIVRYELAMFPIEQIGEHKKGFTKKVMAQLHRDYAIIPFIKKNKINLVACFGPTSVFSTRFCGIPYLAFDDDFEYKIPFYHANWFATRHIFPDFIEFSNSKTHKFHGFKELAYLHPNYLQTSKQVLEEHGIQPNKYVFIREIAGVSLNYKDSTSILSKIVEAVKKKGLEVVLSLEDKDVKEKFSDDCIVLEEPVSDIYSLMYHALFAISSGDTVARETSLLGVPTLYTGGREMVVNKALVDLSVLDESTELAFILDWISQQESNKKEKMQREVLHTIENEWDNTTSVILKHINDFT